MTQNENPPSFELTTPANEVRWWDWPSAIFVVLLLLTAGGRLIATHWTDGVGVVLDFIIIGTLLGMALGRSQFHPALAFLTAVAYGVLILPWRLGATLNTGYTWDDRLYNMIGRVRNIATQILNQKDVTDSFLFILLMGCLFWILSVNAGYVLTRYANAWRIILPAGLTTVVVHYYHNCPVINLRQCVNSDVGHASSYIAVYLLLSLLLVARIYYIRQTRSWRERHTFIHSDVSFDLMRVTVVAVVILMALAWTAPAFGSKLLSENGPLKPINRSLSSVSKFFSHMFASLRFNAGPAPEYFSQGLSLGRGSEISYAIVLQVNAPQPSPTGGNYYWQARVYNQYTNGVWTSNYPYTFDVNPPSTILSSLLTKGSQGSTFYFYAYKDLGLLFYPSQVVSTNRPVTVYSIRTPSGVPDVSMLGLSKTLYSGERYQVVSTLSNVTVKDLRSAGVNYPQWVLENYLQLPTSITPRTIALARQITEGITNPYDQVEAITNYLRENITYSRVIPPLPANQEPIDWFLFDLKEGFCNYYATAEVVMLRSLGIPARMAVGYAQGDSTTPAATPNAPREYVQYGPQTYQVREKDAHAWPEVYFPGTGWIEFEPTSSIREIVRPSGEPVPTQPPTTSGPNPNAPRPTPQIDEPTPAQSKKPLAAQGKETPTTIIVVLVAAVIGLLDLSILIWRVPMARGLVAYYKRWGTQPPAFIKRWAAEEILPMPARLEGGLRLIGLQPPRFLRQWAMYARLNTVGRSYVEINRALQRLGALPAADATPAERATILTQLIPNTSEPVKSLLSEYHQGMYSTHPVDPKTAHQAGREIRKLSYLTVFNRFMDRLGKPIRRKPKKATE